jgi:hypothetical protein
MGREGAFGIILIALLLGGIVLFGRRPPVSSSYGSISRQYDSSGSIALMPVQKEQRRYQNKEIRRIEYNGDGLPTLIEITRDYAIT